MDNRIMSVWAEDDGPVFDGVLPGRLDVGRDYGTLRTRGVPEWLMLLGVRGQGRLRPAGAADWLTLPPRSIVAYRPGVRHEYGTDPEVGSWELLWAHVHPRVDWLALLDWPTCAPGIARLDLSPLIAGRVEAALLRAVTHHRAGLAQARALAMNAVEEALLWCASARPHAGTDAAAIAVVEHISSHLDARHDLRSLASVAGLSTSQLNRTMRASTGDSAMAVVERIRMDAARELLAHTGLSVAQVASRVGYADPLYFSRRFRAAVGVPPREWRGRLDR